MTGSEGGAWAHCRLVRAPSLQLFKRVMAASEQPATLNSHKKGGVIECISFYLAF